MIRKILKWTGITLLTIILLAVVTIASRQNRHQIFQQTAAVQSMADHRRILLIDSGWEE